VDAVVDGTVRRSGDRVRVNLHMVSAQSGETIWSNMFETPATDVLGIEDSISEQVASALSVRLEGGEGGTPARPRRAPCDLDVYQTYIKGRFFWNQRTEEGLHKGLECAREVVSAEPDFPLGYIGLADTYLLLGEYLYAAPQEAFPPALQAARKALSLDPEMAEAHTSLGEYHFYYARDWAAAEKHYRQALRLNPAYASAHSMYMWFLIAMRRFDEALEQIRIAQTLEPGSMVVNTTLGLPFYYAGDYERAARQFRRALEIEPGLRLANYYLGSALVHAGRSEEAVAEFEIMLAAQPLQQARGLLGYCLAVSGRAGEARRVLADLDALERERYVSPYVRAIVHAGLGETGAALDQLERAYGEQAAWVVWLKADPFFKSLSGEPRFVRLVERLRFPS
jgi:Tfp pilus assembly protein PilF